MFGQKLDTSVGMAFPQNRYHTMYKDPSCSPHSYNMVNVSPSSTSSQLYEDGGSPTLEGSNDDLESQHRKRYGRPPGAKDKKPRRRRTKAQMEEDALLYGIKTEEEHWQSPSLKRRCLSRTASLGDLHTYNRSPIFNQASSNTFLSVNGSSHITGHRHHTSSTTPLTRINPFQHSQIYSTSRAYSIVSPLTVSPDDWQRNRLHEMDFSQRGPDPHLNNKMPKPFVDSYAMPFHARSLGHRRSISPASTTFKSTSDGRSSQRSSYTQSDSGASFASMRRDSSSGESAITSPSEYRGKLSVPYEGRYDNHFPKDQRHSDSKSSLGSQSSTSSVGVQLTLQLPQTFRRTVPTLKDLLNDADSSTMGTSDRGDDDHQELRSEHNQGGGRQYNYNRMYDDASSCQIESRRPDIRRLVSS